jgi:hypothetical protein
VRTAISTAPLTPSSARSCAPRASPTRSSLKGSTIRITPPSDTRGSDRRARPFVRRHSGRPPDLRCSGTGGHGQVQSPMWSLRHVVRDVRPEHSLEVPTTVDQDVVEALLAHGPQRNRSANAFARGARIGVRMTRTSSARSTASNGPQNVASRSRRRNRTPASRSSMARFLACSGDPRRVGVRGDTGHVHSPGRALDEEQDVERRAPDRLDGEEVGREDPRRL